jgi:hypothetical protein
MLMLAVTTEGILTGSVYVIAVVIVGIGLWLIVPRPRIQRPRNSRR